MTSPVGEYLLESLLVLLALVLVAAVIVYAARRAGLGRSLGSVELLARLPLEPRRSVYVVRVLDQILILGASEAGLAKLGELPEGAAIELRSGEMAPNLAAALHAAWSRSSVAGQGEAAKHGEVGRHGETAGAVPVSKRESA